MCIVLLLVRVIGCVELVLRWEKRLLVFVIRSDLVVKFYGCSFCLKYLLSCFVVM